MSVSLHSDAAAEFAARLRKWNAACGAIFRDGGWSMLPGKSFAGAPAAPGASSARLSFSESAWTGLTDGLGGDMFSAAPEGVEFSVDGHGLRAWLSDPSPAAEIGFEGRRLARMRRADGAAFEFPPPLPPDGELETPARRARVPFDTLARLGRRTLSRMWLAEDGLFDADPGGAAEILLSRAQFPPAGGEAWIARGERRNSALDVRIGREMFPGVVAEFRYLLA